MKTSFQTTPERPPKPNTKDIIIGKFCVQNGDRQGNKKICVIKSSPKFKSKRGICV